MNETDAQKEKEAEAEEKKKLDEAIEIYRLIEKAKALGLI